MKKMLVGWATGFALMGLLSGAVMAEQGGVSVYVDGEPVAFDVNPRILNDRTMVPMRGIFEALDAQVEWEQETQTVTAQRNDRRVVLRVNQESMTVDGTEVALDVPPVIRENRTLVPIRAIAQGLGVSVEWLEDIKAVSVNTDPDEVEYTELYNLNDIKTPVDKRLVDRYTALGWRDSLEGRYVTMYSSTGKGNIPVNAVELNRENGWQDSAPVLELNDECYFEQVGNYTRLYWHPVNRSGKDIVRYSFDIHYITSDSKKGFRTVTKNISGTFKNGEKIGFTTSLSENGYVEFYNATKAKTLVIGNVEVRYAKGEPDSFWCGQGAGSKGRWEGDMYDSGLQKLSEDGSVQVLYLLYNLEGEEKTVFSAELSDAQAEDWYLTPAKRFYYSDGVRVIAAVSQTEALRQAGLTDVLENIKIPMYSTYDGRVEKILPQQRDSYEQQGWKLYSEPVTVLYSADGRQQAFPESEVAEREGQGWFRNRSEVFETLYNLAGESLEVLRLDAAGYLAQGWYETPVTKVYSTSGIEHVIPREDLNRYLSEGWVTDAEDIKVTVYRPDGSVARIMPYERETYVSDGWYAEPVSRLYAPNGDMAVVRTAEVPDYLAAGWSEKEETFYTPYYTLAYQVQGLKQDRDAYLAAGWRTVPYPILLNTDCRLERASVWSLYTYALNWHPTNTSGQTIDSYRVEYLVPDGEEVYTYSETFYSSVKPGETMGSGGYGDSFLVTLAEGCDALIIGNITLRYADGTVETFWCGQRISLYQETWDGTMYRETLTPGDSERTKWEKVSGLKQMEQKH